MSIGGSMIRQQTRNDFVVTKFYLDGDDSTDLGRFAVAVTHHGKGLGRALLQDAAVRVTHAADAIGIRGMVVHALSEAARDFYLRLGLDESPLDPMTLMVTVNDLRAALNR